MRRAAQPLTWRSDVKKFAKGDLAAPKNDRGQVKRVTDVTVNSVFIKVEGSDEWLTADDYINAPIA